MSAFWVMMLAIGFVLYLLNLALLTRGSIWAWIGLLASIVTIVLAIMHVKVAS